MNTPFISWLNKNMPVSGLLACGLGFADRTFYNLSFEDSYPPEQLDAMWGPVGEVLRQFEAQRLPMSNLRWDFQNAQLLGTVRPDNVCLVLVTAPGLSEQEKATFERLAQDFLEMPAAG